MNQCRTSKSKSAHQGYFYSKRKLDFSPVGVIAWLETLWGDSWVHTGAWIQAHRWRCSFRWRGSSQHLWLSQQPTGQKGTQTLFPVLDIEGWVPHSCPLSWLGWQQGWKLGTARTACTGMFITAISGGYVLWWVGFCALFFTLIKHFER